MNYFGEARGRSRRAVELSNCARNANGRAVFIYRGALYRDGGDAMDWMRKVGWGRWEWTAVKGFAARKIRRAIALRHNEAGAR